MKRRITIILALVFSVSFCAAQQSVQDILREKNRQDSLERVAAAERVAADKAAATRVAAEREQHFNNAIESAERYFDQGEYSQALQEYSRAFELKPEKRALFESRMAELNELVLKAELVRIAEAKEQLYNETIANAEASVAQRRYAEAKQFYLNALALKDKNADFINQKIAELEKPAQLNIYRKGSILTILEDNYDVLLKNVIVGRTKNKWKTSVTVDELETKTVWAAIDGRSSEVHIDFEPGEVYYVRCSLTSRVIKTGVWKTRKKKDGTTERYEETITEYTPKLELVSVSVGEREFNSIKNK